MRLVLWPNSIFTQIVFAICNASDQATSCHDVNFVFTPSKFKYNMTIHILEG